MESLPLVASLATSTGDLQQETRRALVRQLYGNGSTALLATGVNAALVAAVLKPLFATRSLVLWLVCLGTITAARLVLLGAYRTHGRESPNSRLWLGLFVGGVFFSGLVWGSTALFFYPLDSEAHRLFLVFVLGGMMAGATGALAPAPSAYVAFTVPAFCPLAIRLLAGGDALSLAMGIMAWLFASLTTVTVWKNHRILRDGVRHQLENAHLVASLASEAARVRSLNESLRAEVEERVAAATELQHHREHLESLVEARTAELNQERDKAQATSEAKTRFIATLSHEVRTPLNGLLGMLDLLATTELSETQRRHVELAQDSSRSILRLVNDLLDLSAVEAGAIELDEEPFDLRVLVDKTVAPFAVNANVKGVALTVAVSPEVPTQVVGDSHRLRQILNNLVGNAVKFTERSTIRLSVTRLLAATERVLLEFRIQDTGRGFPAGRGERLFQPYRGLTAHADEEARRSCLAAGMDQCLTKPVDAAELCEAVARAVGRVVTSDRPGDPLSPLTRLVDRLGGDIEKVRHLAGLLLARWEEQIEALHGAIARRNREGIETAAHTLVGSLGVYGLDRAAGSARKLEEAAPDGTWAELSTHTGTLEREFEAFRNAVARGG